MNYADGMTFELGILTSVSETFTKSCSTTPIVSKSMDDTIAIESGSGLNLNLRFTRVQPIAYDDTSDSSEDWSNAHWYHMVTLAMDRWQARTDGFTLSYSPYEDNPYIHPFTYNGYIKSLSRRYSKGKPTEISVSMEFHVGCMTMSGGTNAGTYAVLRDEFIVVMSDSARSREFALLQTVEGKEYSCIDSYTLTGGLSTPFEMLSLRIPKKGLGTMASELVDDIVAGKNTIRINAVGIGEYIVAKCKISGDSYRVTAYCRAEMLRGVKLKTGGSLTALGWIKQILCSGDYPVVFSPEGDDPSLIIGATDMTGASNYLWFEKDTNIWHALQVSAMYMGCRIFFTGRKAYVVDYRRIDGWGLSSDQGAGVGPVDFESRIDLYPAKGAKMYGRIKGSATFGDEGTDTLINVVPIRCSMPTPTDDDSMAKETTTVVVEDTRSIEYYGGEYTSSDLAIPALLQGETYAQATSFGKTYLEYRREAQESVRFAVKEMERTEDGMQWAPLFWESTAIGMIYDGPDDETVDNTSEIASSEAYQKLLLSSWTRSYPEGTAEYTFGEIASIDLASSTSQILASSNNG